MPTIVAIVEGDGEVEAFPQLIHRILGEMQAPYDVLVGRGKSGVVNARGRDKLLPRFETFPLHAQNKPRCDAILVLLDSEGDCPIERAKELIGRSEQAGTNCPVQVVCADHMYESWFLASWDTVRHEAGFPNTSRPLGTIDDIPNPKGWIKELMPKDQSYKETSHQAPYTRAIDLDLARQNSRSFRRLCHALELLLGAMDQVSTP